MFCVGGDKQTISLVLAGISGLIRKVQGFILPPCSMNFKLQSLIRHLDEL